MDFLEGLYKTSKKVEAWLKWKEELNRERQGRLFTWWESTKKKVVLHFLRFKGNINAQIIAPIESELPVLPLQ